MKHIAEAAQSGVVVNVLAPPRERQDIFRRVHTAKHIMIADDQAQFPRVQQTVAFKNGTGDFQFVRRTVCRNVAADDQMIYRMPQNGFEQTPRAADTSPFLLETYVKIRQVCKNKRPVQQYASFLWHLKFLVHTISEAEVKRIL